eukprot:gnl/Chilomastix_cuspidata/5404.p2 GENE.gnl/Chilomastix_cuspidata/5404~~gnl/Chilomastix_cuspidata/5404.p2  ORF type:complete len:103 (+),score=39.21 gnl/Chilomastix_cuspidata/5404:34-309(+)
MQKNLSALLNSSFQALRTAAASMQELLELAKIDTKEDALQNTVRKDLHIKLKTKEIIGAVSQLLDNNDELLFTAIRSDYSDAWRRASEAAQ